MPIVGPTPGRRYGHTLVFIKPFLLIFGGNTGNETVNDIWTFNVEKAPFCWNKIEVTSNDLPLVRVYHSASLCSQGSANGMMVVFGGRTADQSALNDTWGLRKHRDGRWDWLKAPYKNMKDAPLGRYQHSTLFLASLLLVIGGRTNNINEKLDLDVYDTETSEWYKFPGILRFRHTNWLLESSLFIHGGFCQSSPNIPTDELLKINLSKAFQTFPNLIKILNTNITEIINPSSFKENEANYIKYGPGSTIYKTITHPSKQLPEKSSQNNKNSNIRLAHQAVIAWSYNPEDTSKKFIRKMSIDKLQEESKKLGIGFQSPQPAYPTFLEDLFNFFINSLLIPKEFSYDLAFDLPIDMTIALIEETQKVFEREPSLLRLKAPLKIFGNINGQFGDLMKLFEHFGTPCDSTSQGDIDGFTYLFLGDYIDFGKYNVEVLCLLFALKLRHPDSIFLLRGHHEDIFVNKALGFAEECITKFEDNLNDSNSIFHKFNRLFEYLPLAALVEENILCVHGGIGSSLNFLSEIDSLERPIEISHVPSTLYEKIIIDLLLSDPVSYENEMKNQMNIERDFMNSGYVNKFGIERINKFMNENSLKLIIRSHENVIDGFEKFANDKIVTIFSNMNYLGKNLNAAAVLIIKKNSELVPKIVYPPQNLLNSIRWVGRSANEEIMMNNALESLKKSGDNDKGVIIDGVYLDQYQIKLRKKNSTPQRIKIMRKN